MANVEYVTWEWVRQHEAKTNEGFQILATVRSELDRAMEDIQREREEREKMIVDERIERNVMHKENISKIEKLTARMNILLGIGLALQFLIGAGIALYAATHH